MSKDNDKARQANEKETIEQAIKNEAMKAASIVPEGDRDQFVKGIMDGVSNDDQDQNSQKVNQSTPKPKPNEGNNTQSKDKADSGGSSSGEDAAAAARSAYLNAKKGARAFRDYLKGKGIVDLRQPAESLKEKLTEFKEAAGRMAKIGAHRFVMRVSKDPATINDHAVKIGEIRGDQLKVRLAGPQKKIQKNKRKIAEIEGEVAKLKDDVAKDPDGKVKAGYAKKIKKLQGENEGHQKDIDGIKEKHQETLAKDKEYCEGQLAKCPRPEQQQQEELGSTSQSASDTVSAVAEAATADNGNVASIDENDASNSLRPQNMKPRNNPDNDNDNHDNNSGNENNDRPSQDQDHRESPSTMSHN